MIQSGGGLGLALKTGESLGFAGYVLRKKLEGDEAIEACVFGFIDHAHSAST